MRSSLPALLIRNLPIGIPVFFMGIPMDMEMGSSLMSYIAPLVAVVLGFLIMLAMDWRRNGG